MGGGIDGERLGTQARGGASFLSNPFWSEFFGTGGSRFYRGLLGREGGSGSGRWNRGMRGMRGMDRLGRANRFFSWDRLSWGLWFLHGKL